MFDNYAFMNVILYHVFILLHHFIMVITFCLFKIFLQKYMNFAQKAQEVYPKHIYSLQN